MNPFSRRFVRFNWWALVFIFLVVIAGSFVRTTGSGMGCPDWPKCFEQWVPPTDSSQIPPNYKERFSQQRAEKVEKFGDIISVFGMSDVAEQLKNDPNLLKEEDFNVSKTWTEYINRLFGFLAGNSLLIIFFWIALYYRKNKRLLLMSFVNLILIAFQAWFGSIVVASNLVPWTITLHLFFALVIIGLQLYVIRLVSPSQTQHIHLSKELYILVWLCFVITAVQMFLGTQVRESIDALTRLGIGREQWTESLGLPFFIHRSFSWLVLGLLAYMAYKNERTYKYKIIRWLFIILAIELLSGVLLAHIDMIGLIQNAHLLFATILFGILFMMVFRIKLPSQ